MDILSSSKKEISLLVPTVFTEMDSARDCFSITYDKKGQRIAYSNMRTALFCLEKILYSLRRGVPYPEGEYVAKNPFRIIVSNTQDESLFIKAAQAGFNSVVVSTEKGAELARRWGLQVILKMSSSLFPFAVDYQELLQREIAAKIPFDALFWKSFWLTSDCKADLLKHAKLKSEIYLEELLTLEKIAPLFYLVSEKNSALLGGPRTQVIAAAEIISSLDVEVPLFKPIQGYTIQAEKPWEEGSYYACNMHSYGAALFGLKTVEEASWEWLSLYRPEISKKQQPLLSLLEGLVEKKRTMLLLKQEEHKLHLDALQAEKKIASYHLSLCKGTFVPEIERFLDSC